MIRVSLESILTQQAEVRVCLCGHSVYSCVMCGLSVFACACVCVDSSVVARTCVCVFKCVCVRVRTYTLA